MMKLAARSIAIPAVLMFTSCDRRPAGPPPSSSTTAPSAAEARRIPLVSIPFTAVVSEGWDVRAGPGGQLVLNGKTPDGDEINVQMTRREPIGADALPALLATLAPTTARSAAAADAGVLTRRIDDREGVKVIEETERTGPADQAADLAPFRWKFQYIIVGNGLLAPCYELNVSDLTLLSYQRNWLFLRPMFDSVQYDATAASAAR